MDGRERTRQRVVGSGELTVLDLPQRPLHLPRQPLGDLEPHQVGDGEPLELTMQTHLGGGFPTGNRTVDPAQPKPRATGAVGTAAASAA